MILEKLDVETLTKLLKEQEARLSARLNLFKIVMDEIEETLDTVRYITRIGESTNESDSTQKQPSDYLWMTYTPFGEHKSNNNRIVLFYSNHCEPCIYLKPILELVVLEHNLELELVLVDEELGRQHAEKHKINGFPTMFVVKDNVVHHMMIGANSNASVEETRKQLTNELLPFFR